MVYCYFECTINSQIRKENPGMSVKPPVAILFWSAIASTAYAQSAVTNEDAQRVIQAISADKGKIKAYCDMVELGRRMDTGGQSQDQQAEQDRLNELTQKVGPEFGAMVDEYKQLDLSSAQGQETGAIVQTTLNTLNNLCGPEVSRPKRD
jgi:excinuclease UvrABC nuclease subunit